MIRSFLHHYLIVGTAATFMALPFPLLHEQREASYKPVQSGSFQESDSMISELSRVRGNAPRHDSPLHSEEAPDKELVVSLRTSSTEEEHKNMEQKLFSLSLPFLPIESRASAKSESATNDNVGLPLETLTPLATERPKPSTTEAMAFTPTATAKTVNAQNDKATVKQPIIGAAERIEVPSLGIDLPVQPGAYDATNQTWVVDDSSAFHATTTVPVNDTNGTTLIYGHAKWGIFGSLPDIQPGAEATIYTAEGMKFVYVLESVRQVDPSDVSMLIVEGEPKLVLQTCSGWLDQHRTMATFAFKEAIQA